MLILSIAKARRTEVGLGCGVDLRASINGLSRNLEAFERRNLTIDLRFACVEIKLSLKLLKFKKKCR